MAERTPNSSKGHGAGDVLTWLKAELTATGIDTVRVTLGPVTVNTEKNSCTRSRTRLTRTGRARSGTTG